MRITIEQATLHHVDSVAALFDQYRQFYRKPTDVEAARRFITERLQKQDALILLAVDEARNPAHPVGFTQLYPTFSSVRMRPVWILNDLFVVPEARGRGVGRALMNEAARRAREEGVVALSLATEKNNTSAKQCHQLKKKACHCEERSDAAISSK